MDHGKALLLSSSRYANHELLAYAKDEITSFLKERNVSQILFIPYALFDYDEYTEKMKKPLKQFGFDLKGIHTFPNASDAVANAEAIFIGGGNTFKLLKTLHENMLVTKIRGRVKEGIPYIGSSAGTNVATINICTTNDMPIVYPPTFDGIGIVPFNINPHYLETDPNSTHKGETRDQRINQYHELPNTPPVLGLREGSLLHLHDGKLTLKGFVKAKLFVRGKEAVEYDPGSDLTFLLH